MVVNVAFTREYSKVYIFTRSMSVISKNQDRPMIETKVG
jgi:hypothetical protein